MPVRVNLVIPDEVWERVSNGARIDMRKPIDQLIMNLRVILPGVTQSSDANAASYTGMRNDIDAVSPIVQPVVVIPEPIKEEVTQRHTRIYSKKNDAPFVRFSFYRKHLYLILSARTHRAFGSPRHVRILSWDKDSLVLEHTNHRGPSLTVSGGKGAQASIYIPNQEYAYEMSIIGRNYNITILPTRLIINF